MNARPKTDAAAWPAGFRLNPRAAHLDPALVEAFRGVPTAHASDVMGRATGARGLLAYHGSLSLGLCGPAVTVRIRPGDNLMIHAAMAVAEPGDVVVIDGGGNLSTAVIGGLMRTSAIARKLGGFVIDGALRDVAEWAEGVMPVYARGHGHRGPSKDGPGEVNVPVACAGLAVSPGDLVLGDADGVVAIPAADAERILHLCRAHAAREEGIRRNNASGVVDHERFNALLRAKGCPV
jgi:regulator of RNase E activity RraA